MNTPSPKKFKIGIVGPESTGKSTLTQALAQHYKSSWVPEYARDYLENHTTAYVQEDLLPIARGQIQTEEEAWKKTTQFLFCDTTLLVIKIWSEEKYGNTTPWIEAAWHKQKYDLYLLTAIDIPWTPDPLREHPKEEDRKRLFMLYERMLREAGAPYVCLTGTHKARLQTAIQQLDALL